MPMLVDMNIHYRLLKLMHGSSTAQYDFGMWMFSLPVLYGVWHPYKYCVQAVYRVFFPIFVLLETTDVQVGKSVSGVRRILHIEKMVLALLLLRHKVVARAQNVLQYLGDSLEDQQKRRGFVKKFFGRVV